MRLELVGIRLCYFFKTSCPYLNIYIRFFLDYWFCFGSIVIFPCLGEGATGT